SRAGTFAEKVTVPVESLVHPPADWTDEQSAGATLVYLTAFQAISQWSDPPLPKDCVTLVTGASGGVGVASIQLAKAMGHTVVGLSRSEKKAQRLRELGADAVYDPGEVKEKVKEFLGTRRVDLVIDNVAGPQFAEMIGLLG